MNPVTLERIAMKVTVTLNYYTEITKPLKRVKFYLCMLPLMSDVMKRSFEKRESEFSELHQL